MSTLIKDTATRNEIDRINKRLQKLDNIPQLQKDATLSDIIRVLNIIIAKDKAR